MSEFRVLILPPTKSVCLRHPLKKKVKVENSCLSVKHHVTQNNSIHFRVKSHFAFYTCREKCSSLTSLMFIIIHSFIIFIYSLLIMGLLLVPYWRRLQLSSASFSLSVCLFRFSFPHFFSLCVWGIIRSCWTAWKWQTTDKGYTFVASGWTIFEKFFFLFQLFNVRVRRVLNKRGK